MGHATYPTGDDVAAVLESMGLSTTGLDVETAASVGRRDFEGTVMRRMLAVAQSRVYDPTSDSLGRLLVGDWAQVDSIVFQGATLQIGIDYRLEPLNALADVDDPKPYTCVRFNNPRRYCYATASSDVLTIAGLYGYAIAIPDDAWDAMRRIGALTLLDSGQASAAGGHTAIPSSWREALSQESYGSGSSDPVARVRSESKDVIDCALAHYADVVL